MVGASVALASLSTEEHYYHVDGIKILDRQCFLGYLHVLAFLFPARARVVFVLTTGFQFPRIFPGSDGI